MNITELLWGYWSNLQVIVVLTAIICGIALLIVLSVAYIKYDNGDDERSRAMRIVWRRLLPITLICGVVACFPSLDMLWQVRINLIKLELASPENVQQATETIERIGRKLECKYIGGKDCEEQK